MSTTVYRITHLWSSRKTAPMVVSAFRYACMLTHGKVFGSVEKAEIPDDAWIPVKQGEK